MKAGFVVTDRKAPGISEAAARSLRQFKKGFFNRRAVIDAIGEKQAERLAIAGDYVKEAARRSMRYRKKPSLPGTPPSANAEDQSKALLRKHLYFAFDAGRKTIVVGPAKLGQSRVASLHEHGGKHQRVRRKPKQVGQSGPVRLIAPGLFNNEITAKKKYIKWAQADVDELVVYARLRTPRQAAKSTQIEEMLYSKLDQTFPPRPFMKPTIENPKVQRFIRDLFSRPL